MPEASEFDQWEPEGETSSCPVTAVIPTWRTLTTLDMSHNSISQIDDSVVRNTFSFVEESMTDLLWYITCIRDFVFALYVSFFRKVFSCTWFMLIRPPKLMLRRFVPLLLRYFLC